LMRVKVLAILSGWVNAIFLNLDQTLLRLPDCAQFCNAETETSADFGCGAWAPSQPDHQNIW
jgi:hypothetical protein